MTNISIKLKHKIKVRKPVLDFDRDIPRFWFRDNPVITHGFNGFNLVIPEYERFFVRSVLRLKHCINDPELLEQINDFAAQEALHAKAHEDYFKWLEGKNYKFSRYLKWLKRYAAFSERMSTKKYNIAYTAAAEHFTATIGTLCLTESGLIDNMNPTMERFITWHSAEEIEHKAVAFDVMQAAGVGYFTRVFAYTIMMLDMFIWITIGTFMLVRQDKISLLKMFRYKRKFKKEVKGVNKRFRKLLFSYYRRDFHPNKSADLELAYEKLNKVGIDHE